MDVIRAEVLGMCFGVRDALRAIAGVSRPMEVTVHGQLVHNEEVSRRLQVLGFGTTGECEEARRGVPATPVVLITAHGVSDRERARLESAGKTLIDTTCPLVTRAHDAAKKLHADGYFVVVIGRRDHVEVRGIVGDLERFEVVGSVDDVTVYPADRIGVVAQTTTPERVAARVRDTIVARNPQARVKYVDTVCLPTKEHQRSLERLIDRVDAMVVVGGRQSNNTRELAALCRERGTPAWQVAEADEIDPSWFEGVATVGLTAGTSTLDETIRAVEDALRAIPSKVRGAELMLADA